MIFKSGVYDKKPIEYVKSQKLFRCANVNINIVGELSGIKQE
jgi:hypothetical protein